MLHHRVARIAVKETVRENVDRAGRYRGFANSHGKSELKRVMARSERQAVKRQLAKEVSEVSGEPVKARVEVNLTISLLRVEFLPAFHSDDINLVRDGVIACAP